MREIAISLVLGVVSSILATLLIVAAAGIVSRTARWMLTGVLGRLLGIDVEVVFSSPREAAEEIRKELLSSRRILIMTGRGSELQRETFSPLFASNRLQRDIRILLPYPFESAEQSLWMLRREAEVQRFDEAYGEGLLRRQIQATLSYLEGFAQKGIVKLRLFNFPHLGRILLTESHAYFTPYVIHSHSRDSRVIKYRRGGDMYNFLERLFNEVWETSVDAANSSGDGR